MIMSMVAKISRGLRPCPLGADSLVTLPSVLHSLELPGAYHQSSAEDSTRWCWETSFSEDVVSLHSQALHVGDT